MRFFIFLVLFLHVVIPSSHAISHSQQRVRTRLSQLTTTSTSDATTPICSPGYYYFIRSETCVACPAGRISNPAGTSCTSCPAGTYAPLTGSSECKPCATGKWSSIGSKTCIDVNCAKYKGYIGTGTNCACANNFYGTARVESGSPAGCLPWLCNTLGVTGASGQCVCDTKQGYTGTVTYDSVKGPGGCTKK